MFRLLALSALLTSAATTVESSLTTQRRHNDTKSDFPIDVRDKDDHTKPFMAIDPSIFKSLEQHNYPQPEEKSIPHKTMGKALLKKSRDVRFNLTDRIKHCKQAVSHLRLAYNEKPNNKKLRRLHNEASRECGILYFELSQITPSSTLRSFLRKRRYLHASARYLPKPKNKLDKAGSDIIRARADSFSQAGVTAYNAIFINTNDNHPKLTLPLSLRDYAAAIQDCNGLIEANPQDGQAFKIRASSNLGIAEVHLELANQEQHPSKIRAELNLALEKSKAALADYKKLSATSNSQAEHNIKAGVATYYANRCIILNKLAILEPQKSKEHLFLAQSFQRRALARYKSLLPKIKNAEFKTYVHQQINMLNNLQNSNNEKTNDNSDTTKQSVVGIASVAVLLYAGYNAKQKKQKKAAPQHNDDHEVQQAASPAAEPHQTKKKKKKQPVAAPKASHPPTSAKIKFAPKPARIIIAADPAATATPAKVKVPARVKAPTASATVNASTASTTVKAPAVPVRAKASAAAGTVTAPATPATVNASTAPAAATPVLTVGVATGSTREINRKLQTSPKTITKQYSAAELTVRDAFQLDVKTSLDIQAELKESKNWPKYTNKLRAILFDDEKKLIEHFDVLIDEKFQSPRLMTVFFPELIHIWSNTNEKLLQWVEAKVKALPDETTPKKFEKFGRILMAACAKTQSVKSDLEIKNFLASSTIAKAFGACSSNFDDYERDRDLHQDFCSLRELLHELSPSTSLYAQVMHFKPASQPLPGTSMQASGGQQPPAPTMHSPGVASR